MLLTCWGVTFTLVQDCSLAEKLYKKTSTEYRKDSDEQDLAVRASWLSYVGGYSQEQIAKRLGVSRIKTHRLIASAHKRGLIKLSINHSLSDLIDLEDRLSKRFKLDVCTLAPKIGNDKSVQTDADWTALGMAGAQFLKRQLQTTSALTIGLGWGRTLGAVAEQTCYKANANHRVVALIGSLTRHSAANPYDVIHKLVDRTGAEGYYLPVPHIADTLADKAVFVAQKNMQDMLALARKSDVCLVGIGQCTPHSFLKESKLITAKEFSALKKAGAVGDLIGRFFNAKGELVNSEVNARSIGLELDELAQRKAIGIAGGLDKVKAIYAALKSGVLSGLITDEQVAQKLLKASE